MAKTSNSAAAGLWSASATWTNGVPVATDTVTINHAVKIGAAAAAADVTLGAGGSIEFTAAVELTLSSTLTIGDRSNFIAQYPGSTLVTAGLVIAANLWTVMMVDKDNSVSGVYHNRNLKPTQ